jgi:hypothetical protein
LRLEAGVTLLSPQFVIDVNATPTGVFTPSLGVLRATLFAELRLF